MPRDDALDAHAFLELLRAGHRVMRAAAKAAVPVVLYRARVLVVRKVGLVDVVRGEGLRGAVRKREAPPKQLMALSLLCAQSDLRANLAVRRRERGGGGGAVDAEVLPVRQFLGKRKLQDGSRQEKPRRWQRQVLLRRLPGPRQISTVVRPQGNRSPGCLRKRLERAGL